MSTFSGYVPRSVKIETVRNRVFAVFFGDRIGLTLFLATLVVATLTWRVGFFINDNYTVANLLVNVADGNLHIARVVYGPESGMSPGVVVHNGRRIGVNYGQVFAALPFVWLFRALTAVTALAVLLAGLWSLLVVALAVQVGRLLDSPRAITIAGSALALGLFAGNLAVAQPLAPRWTVMVALQTSTMVWAGLLAVTLYRLTSHIHDRRTGVFVGLATILATPVGFWASIPKRHVLVSLLAVAICYCFYRSRTEHRSQLHYRAAAYALGGLTMWVMPLEGMVVLLVLAPPDLATAPANDRRALATVAVIFGLSLLPFFLTNLLVTGNPFKPPRFVVHGVGGGGGSAKPLVLKIADTALSLFDRLWADHLLPGVTILATEPDRLLAIFVRSGYLPEVAAADGGEAINMALLESAPILAGLLAVASRVRTGAPTFENIAQWLRSPVGQTDVFAGVFVALFALVYLPSLPIHAMVTVRYLVPIFPFLVYFVARLSPVRSVLHENVRMALLVYGGTVLVGGQLLLIYLLTMTPARGEAIQLHAWLGLAAALGIGLWAIATLRKPVPRLGAIVLAVAAATTTVFILLSAWLYFAYAGQFAFPLVEWLSTRLVWL